MMFWSPSESDSACQLQVTARSRKALLHDLEHRLQDAHGFALATLNLDHVVKLRRQPEFCQAYLAQTHVTADGNPIVWLSRLAGQRVELIPGSELIGPVTELAVRTQTKIALLGTTQEALSRAAQRLQQQYPGVQVVLTLSPAMDFDPQGPVADAALDAIANSGAGLCFLAFGAPKQEIFAARAYARLSHVGFLSIGAGLDFIAGTQHRAPRLVRVLAAEWLWRLANDPGRLAARYGACLCILPALIWIALRIRRAG